ncbi:MAG: ATP synthase F1 subunit gamma [Lachnospiraceae bacterium]|nr:ATP synthase F1 subunit gamma [Lachnospiraceae bacterium]
MATMRELSARIRSVQDTMKITNAMYMISSTKLHKARREMDNNSPYFLALQKMLAHILVSLPEIDHPYLDLRPEKKGKNRVRAIVVISGDKGLAGAYNHNVLRLVESMLSGPEQTLLYVVGEVGRSYFASRRIHMEGQFRYTSQNPTLHRARVISEKLLEDFREGAVDEVDLVYTTMPNSITSVPAVMPLLPLRKKDVLSRLPKNIKIPEEELNFQPSPQSILDNMVPDLLVGYVYSALVDSYCSEQNDRMMAMDAANRNGQEMIRTLSMEYNRVRQSAITQEITEVIAGAKAQKKKKKQRRPEG